MFNGKSQNPLVLIGKPSTNMPFSIANSYNTGKQQNPFGFNMV